MAGGARFAMSSAASHGGGFEWTFSTGLVGITAPELGADGLITRITSVYDSRQRWADHKAALIGAGFASSP
jgi:hypothetical protein